MRADDVDYDGLERVAYRAAGKFLFASAGHQVEDVVSESMTEFLVYERDHEIDNPAAFITTVAKRKAMKYRDSWEAKRGVDWIDDPEAVKNDGRIARAGRAVVADDDGAGDPLNGVIRAADHDALRWAVAQLDDIDRKIVELTYLGTAPRTALEVGDQLGLAPKTVRNRLVAIRRELAAVLTDLDAD